MFHVPFQYSILLLKTLNDSESYIDVANMISISFMPQVEMLCCINCGNYTSTLVYTEEYLRTFVHADKTEQISSGGDQL